MTYPKLVTMSVKEKIDKQNAKFMNYVIKQDIEGVVSLYTEDACFMGPNVPMAQGREVLKMAFKGLFDAGVKEIKLNKGVVLDSGDYVLERSTYTQKIQPPGMSVIEDKGKYVVVWKKTPDGYKIFWDIVNSDLPPPPTT